MKRHIPVSIGYSGDRSIDTVYAPYAALTVDAIEEYNKNDETQSGGYWETENAEYLKVDRKGAYILRKHGRNPTNQFFNHKVST